MQRDKNRTLFITRFALFLAIEALFCFTILGSLPALGPIVATLGMLPIIVTSIVLGTGAGTAMGAFAGLFSVLVWTFAPPNPPVAFVFTPFYSMGEFSGNFWSLAIAVVPRILTGTVTGVIFHNLRSLFGQKRGLRYAVSGFLGSMTNTLLVMGGVALFFGGQYASVFGTALIYLISATILTSGIPEALLGALCAWAVGSPLRRLDGKTD